MSKNARVLESKTIFRGRVVELKVDQVIEPGGVRTSAKLCATRVRLSSYPISQTAA